MKKLLLVILPVVIAIGSYAQTQQLGIGTNAPKSKVSATDGLSVGSNYSINNIAPVNGAIIEGPVGLGTSAPDASAALDIKGSNKGVLLPSVDLSSVSWAPAAGPATGLVVWNSNAAFGSGIGLYYNNGTPLSPVWLMLANSVSALAGVTASAPLQSSGGTSPNISLTGIISIANGGTNASAFTSNNQFLWFDGARVVSSTYSSANFLSSATGTANYIPKFTGANAISNSQIFDNGANVGIGSASPNAKLDLNGNLSLREGQTLVIANGGTSGGTNDNIILPDVAGSPGIKASFYRITGPTAPFSIFGITPATSADGQIITLVNTTSNAVTFKNNASSTSANAIKTLAGSDITSLSANSSVTLQYNKTDAGWYVTATQNFVAPSGSVITKNIVPGTGSAITIANGTNQVVGGGNVVLDVTTNTLNQKGIVSAPTALNGNQGWITDNTGNPTWAPLNTAIAKKDITSSTAGITLGNNTGQVIGGSNLTIDIATNSSSSKGLVTATGGTAGKVWSTDGSGNPGWNAVSNSMLANPGVTVNTGTGLSGGGTINLGGTLNLANTGVTSVGMSLPSILSISASPVTTTGTFTGSLATQAANLVFAGPASGGAASPGFRALTGADLPGGSSTYIQNQFGSAQGANYWINGTGRMPVLNLTDGNTSVTQGSGYSMHVTTPYGYTETGPQNGGWSHFYTDRPQYYFNKRIAVDEGIVSSYAQDLQLQTSGTTQVTISNSTGNVGIGNPTPGRKLEVNGDIKIPANNQIYLGENVSTSSKIGINFHTDADPNYGIYKPAGAWVQPLHIGFYTGVKIGANTGYGGTKFYASSDMGTQLMSVGDGDNNVRVNNYLFASYLNSADNSVGSGVTGVMIKAGDNYHRTGTAAAVNAFLGISAPTGDNLGNHIATVSIKRTDHAVGFFEGSYNNVGANDSKSNPIYTIGSNYNPSNTALNNMYGIGYSHSNFWSTSGNRPPDWGMYVSAAGTTRVIADAGGGVLWAASDFRAPIYHDIDNMGYYLDMSSNTSINGLQTNNTLAGWSGFNGITQAYGHYIWPGENDGSGTPWQQNWCLASNSSYGLYSNTGLDMDGTLYWGGTTVIDYPAGWHRSYWATGMYNGSYGGGMYMQDGSWVRVYGGINFISQSSNPGPALRGDQGYSPSYYAQELYAYGSNPGYQALYAYGYCESFNYYGISSRTKKKDIEKLTDEDYASALLFVDTVELNYYKYKDEDQFYHKTHIGLIAEEAPTTLTAPGKIGVSYGDLGIFNTGAIKNLKKRVEKLESASENISDFGVEHLSSTRQTVKFSDDFKARLNGVQPVVKVTASKLGLKLKVLAMDKDGFVVEAGNTDAAATFNWIAMAKTRTVNPMTAEDGVKGKFATMLQSAENDTRPIPQLSKTPDPAIRPDQANIDLQNSKIVPGLPVNPNTPNGHLISKEALKWNEEHKDAIIDPKPKE